MRIYLTGATPSFDVASTASLDERFGKTGRNTGNQLIGFGLLNRLRYDEASWEPMSADEVNERFDHVVVAAANFLHIGFDFSYLADFLEQIRVPISVVGLGAQSNSFAVDVPLQPGTERLVSVLKERCRSIGVRGHYTAEVLDRRGIENFQITGCPSYYASLGHEVPEDVGKLPDEARIAVNASRDVIRHSFDPKAMRIAVRKLVNLAVGRAADFVAQTEHLEMAISEGNRELVGDLLSDLWVSVGAAFEPRVFGEWAVSSLKVYWDVQTWIQAMQQKDFVLGTRFHGAMAALLGGTPALVVCHDTRTTEMCRFLQVPNIDLKTFNVLPLEELYASVDLAAYRARRAVLDRRYVRFLQENRLDPLSYDEAGAGFAGSALSLDVSESSPAPDGGVPAHEPVLPGPPERQQDVSVGTNLTLFSQDFGNPAWDIDINCLERDAATAPDGSLTADIWTHHEDRTGFFQIHPVLPDTVYTFSVHVKLSSMPAEDYRLAFYDETAGEWIGKDISPLGSPSSAAWARCSHTVTTPPGCTLMRCYPFRHQAAAPESTVQLWGAQLELGSAPTDYVPHP